MRLYSFRTVIQIFWGGWFRRLLYYFSLSIHGEDWCKTLSLSWQIAGFHSFHRGYFVWLAWVALTLLVVLFVVFSCHTDERGGTRSSGPQALTTILSFRVVLKVNKFRNLNDFHIWKNSCHFATGLRPLHFHLHFGLCCLLPDVTWCIFRSCAQQGL